MVMGMKRIIERGQQDKSVKINIVPKFKGTNISFFAVLARRLTAYMSNNGYINTSVRNGGVPEFPRSLEPISTIPQLNRNARINHGDLTAVCLVLANAHKS